MPYLIYLCSQINTIVETVDRYNTDNLVALEEYVREQMHNNTIDRTANLAVLKLYQFNPDKTNVLVVTSILALALAALPDPDFNLCLCLLTEDVLNEPAVARLIEMQHLLEHCRFERFWQMLEEDEAQGGDDEDRLDILRDYPEFDTRVRRFISSTLASSYQSISLPTLQRCLNLDGEDLADWISVIGATVNGEQSHLIDFPVSRDNQSKPVIVQETIKFEQLTKLIGASADPTLMPSGGAH
ncbi:hypothetical protein HK101_007490 [Irineochytrium annulatum]|nr:hypothetical protein HK101_007490 [Irineochytrium annulatum]